jgi:crotonobetainyl-CoA:carnitine CoA-transferase CaiB-like acyl-CoA transferase
MFLGDFGAEVAKVEQPKVGDDSRGWGPPFIEKESAYFLSINRNKKSITIDMKTAEGVELVRRLASAADVLIENFRPGTMERFGLGEADLRAANPRLIYASLSGFGADGPMKDWPGYDLVIQAYGGFMSITGQRDGEPTKVAVAIIDIVAGLMLGKAIMAALFARERSGVGQNIDTSLLEAEVACLIPYGSDYLATGKVPGRWGNAHPNIVPYQTFNTRDGYMVVGAASEGNWQRLCQAVDKPELAKDPRFASNAQRVAHREELIAILQDLFRQRETAGWIKILSDAGLPCGPVNTIDRVFNDPQVRHRNMLLEVEHPTAGTVRMAGLPVKFSATPASLRLAPPLLGQHSGEILRSWLAMPEEKIQELKGKRII